MSLSLKSTGSHTNRKTRLISFLIHTFSKKLENSKTLSSSLPLILSGPATKKGKSFHARVIYFYFHLKNHKFGKDSSYSHLRIHDFLQGIFSNGILNKTHYFTIYYQNKRLEIDKTFGRERKRNLRVGVTTSVILASHHHQDAETLMGNFFFLFSF